MSFNKEYPTVVCLEGMHVIVLPNGEHLKGIIMTRVTDDCDEFPEVLIKANCNIAKDYDDAMKQYND